MTRSAKDIFADSLELAPSAREAFLQRACAGNPSLLAEVRELLRAHPGDAGFLGAPTVKVAGGGGGGGGSGGAGLGGSADAEEQPGAIIGRYKLLQVIGEGGFGRVFMAEQREPVTRKVALKLIKLGMDTRQVIARFEAERQALAMMDHPNIARVLDAGATGTGRPFFVMELVRGDPITQYCDLNNLSTQSRLELFKQVCLAVQHAHQKGIIHRDLKPSNVLVTIVDGRPVPKVIDFGIAKATNARLTEKTVFTEFRQLIGTPEYMSPEQAEMSGVDIDTRSDVYSLGVLLYELLTGSTPFEGKKLRSAAWGELQRIIREEEPPKPSQRLSTMKETIGNVASHRATEPARLLGLVRGELDWIVMKCLEKDRTRRYDAASALATDIDRYLSGAPVAAAPPSASYRLRKFARRNRAMVLTGAILALALLAGITGTTVGLLRAQEQRDRAVKAEQEKDALLTLAQSRERKAQEEAQRADREAKSAEQSATIARSANRFITDVISKANRGTQKGNPDVKVREVLDTAADEIAKDPGAYEPEVREASLDVIGQTYTALGLYDRAEKPLRDAIELTKARLGPEHEDVAVTMSQLVSALSAAGRYEQAEELGREALRIITAAKGDAHPRTAQAMTNLAAVLPDRGKLDESIKLSEAAVKIYAKDPDKHARALAPALNNLAVALTKRGNIDAAIAAHREAIDVNLQIERKSLDSLGGASGSQNPELATAINSLGMAYYFKRDYAEAEKLVLQGLEMRRRLLGPDHPDVGVSLNNLGGITQAAGRLDEAEKYLLEALELRRKALGEDAAVTIGSIENLANLEQDRNNLEKAERLYREALAAYERTLGPRDVQVSETKSNLATLLAQKGDSDGALALLREALELRREISGNNHPSTALCLGNLAATHFRRGDYKEAEAYTREALGIERALSAGDNPTVAASMVNLGMSLRALHRYEEAEEMLRPAAIMAEKHFGPEHTRTLAAKMTLGWTLSNLAWSARVSATDATRAKAAEGEQFLRDLLAVRMKSAPADNPNLITTHALIAQAELVRLACESPVPEKAAAIERLRALETRLLDAHDRLSKLPPAQYAVIQRPGAPRPEEVLDRLYTLWHELEPGTGKDTLAAEWRAKVAPSK